MNVFPLVCVEGGAGLTQAAPQVMQVVVSKSLIQVNCASFAGKLLSLGVALLIDYRNSPVACAACWLDHSVHFVTTLYEPKPK